MTDSDFFDVYIIYYIFAMEKSLPGIIILLSDDRVFSFQYLPGVGLASLYSGFYKYFLVICPLNSYVGLMISLEYTISVVISRR